MVEWVNVRSNAIHRVGYDPATRRMYIDFHDGTPQYTFCRVPERVFSEFVSAASVGRYYHRHIRDHYQC